MRQALRQNRSRAQVARAASIPAPYLGWNTEDSLLAMKPGYAVVLDNMIPRGGRCELRRGFIEQCTGTSDPVETLIVYGSGANGEVMFAAAGDSLFDVTTAGALPSAAYASAASARWNYTNFANDAGRFAILVNGEQNPLKYDGSTFSTNAITGASGSITLDDADLKWVFQHQRRLHFLEKETLRVWYLATNAIAGAADGLLDLGPIFRKGGYLVGGATLTLDGGNGPDDFACYLTNMGQVAIYQGTDPSDTNAWSLVGVFDLPKPIGDRSLIRYGADLAVLTEGGLLPLTPILRAPREEQGKLALSRKINPTIAAAANDSGSLFGWQPVLYPGRGGLIIVNVPTAELSTSAQYVRSTESGGWCRFTGIDAFCWANANGMIYFGSTEGVYRWDVGASDNSDPIVPDVLPAFSDFGNRTITKNFTMVRALMRAPSIFTPALQVVTDYDVNTIPTAVQTVVMPGDLSPDDATLIRNAWTGASGVGYVGSPRWGASLTGSDDVDRVGVTSGATELLLVGPGGSDHVLTRPNLPLDVPVELVGFDIMFVPGGQL